MAYDVDNWQKYYAPHSQWAPSKYGVHALSEKYTFDLEKLEQGIWNAVEKYGMFQYPLPNGYGVPGYYGLCFKAKPNSENPLADGLGSNVLYHNPNYSGPIDLEFTEKTDAWFPYLDDITSRFRGTVTQVRLIKLEKGHNLSYKGKPHIDYPWYQGIRLHIPLTSGIDYVWNILGENHIATKSNRLLFFNAGVPHDARNESNSVDRYLLNINIVPVLDKHIDEQILLEEI